MRRGLAADLDEAEAGGQARSRGEGVGRQPGGADPEGSFGDNAIDGGVDPIGSGGGAAGAPGEDRGRWTDGHRGSNQTDAASVGGEDRAIHLDGTIRIRHDDADQRRIQAGAIGRPREELLHAS